MTREDLEKAIKNGKSLWYIFMKEIFKIEIKKHINQFISRDNEYCYTDEKKVERCFPIEALFKTRVEAEHYLNHANITRTEQLPFYTFSEIAKDEKNFKMGKTYTLIEDKNFVLDINKSYVSQIVLYTGKEKYSWNFNEENFYKAYDECVRLFRGEE